MNTKRPIFCVLLTMIVTAGCERPLSSVEHLERGILLAQRERFDEAMLEFDRSLALLPGVPAVYYERAIVRARLGQLDAALEDYRQAIVLDPQFVQAFFSRGELLERMLRFEDAIDEYTAALQLEPTFLEAAQRRGILRHRSGDRDGAMADFARVIELQPTAEAYRACGLIHLEREQFELAESAFSKAIEIDPSLARAWTGRAVSRCKMGNREAALADLQQASSLDLGIVGLDVLNILAELNAADDQEGDQTVENPETKRVASS